MIEAALNHSQSHEFSQESKVRRGLFSRKGLIRYILSCCQSKGGGLRDKPYTFVHEFILIFLLTDIKSTGVRMLITHATLLLGSAPHNITTTIRDLKGMKQHLHWAQRYIGLHHPKNHRRLTGARIISSMKKTD